MMHYGASLKERTNWKPKSAKILDPLTVERNRIYKSLQVILKDTIKEHWWRHIEYAIYEEERRF
jgi:hypothetical protein